MRGRAPGAHLAARDPARRRELRRARAQAAQGDPRARLRHQGLTSDGGAHLGPDRSAAAGSAVLLRGRRRSGRWQHRPRGRRPRRARDRPRPSPVPGSRRLLRLSFALAGRPVPPGQGLHPGAPGRSRARSRSGGAGLLRLHALPAPRVRRRRSHRGGMDPLRALGALPSRPGRPGAGAPLDLVHRHPLGAALGVALQPPVSPDLRSTAAASSATERWRRSRERRHSGRRSDARAEGPERRLRRPARDPRHHPVGGSRRGGGADGRQRRRQDHDPARHLGPAQAGGRKRQPWRWRSRTAAMSSPTERSRCTRAPSGCAATSRC